MSELNLRESKRRATATALAQAAFDLALDRGVDGFTIDEVAARAGYSRRTFANYYSGKEDAIVAVAVERVVHALDAVLNRRDVSPIHAHLLVGAAYGALTSVLEGHISIRSKDSPECSEHESGPSMTLDSFLNLTFAHLRDGF